MLDGRPHPHIETTQELGMSHLAFRGISEHFLMRRLADVHWTMIARALGQSRAVFRDAAGGHVHPATCAFSLTVFDPSGASAVYATEIRMVANSITLPSPENPSRRSARNSDSIAPSMLSAFGRYCSPHKTAAGKEAPG